MRLPATARATLPAIAPRHRASWWPARRKAGTSCWRGPGAEFDVDFRTTCGIVHVAQPGQTVRQLTHEVRSFDAFRLAGLSPLVTIGGSLVAALAVAEHALSADEAWAAVTIDDQWQREQWGADSEAEAALEERHSSFVAAARFLDLLGS